MGELPGGTTGRCVLPVGNTGATAGCVPVDDGINGVTGGTLPAAGAPGAAAGAAAAASGEAAASPPPIVAGGPLSDMLLCVPM